MWDDEIDQKIKEAAGQYHPAYDDDAWIKMEQLLDKHLPTKKDRRRIIYFLPLSLLVGAGVFFLIFRTENMHSPQGNYTKSTVAKSSVENTTAADRGSTTANEAVLPGKTLTEPKIKNGPLTAAGVNISNAV